MQKNDISKQSNRLDYLDMVKGIAIILVIAGHTYSENPIKIWLYSFHLPLFFIVSGCLLNYKNEENQNIKRIIIKRIRNLIIPYVTFSILILTLGIILSKFSMRILMADLKDTIIFNGIGVMWFLPALFISEVLFHIIRKITNKDYIRIIIIVVLFCIPLMLNLNNDSNIILIVVARSFIALGFISLGYYMFKFISKINLPYYSIFILIIVNIVLSQYNGLVDLHKLIFNNFFVYAINSIIGSITMILLFKKCKNINTLSYLGINSLIIMCTHNNIIAIVRATGHGFSGYVTGTILIIFIIVLEYPIITIINNYIPIMLGRRKRTVISKVNGALS